MNGVCNITVNGVSYSLKFGMRAIMIFQEKSLAAVIKLNEGEEDKSKWKDIDPVKQLVYLVYAGLCNDAESKDLEYPKFEDCYSLVDDILAGKDADAISVKIFNAFKESRAGAKLIEMFNPKKEDEKAESDVKKKNVRKTG